MFVYEAQANNIIRLILDKWADFGLGEKIPHLREKFPQFLGRLISPILGRMCPHTPI